MKSRSHAMPFGAQVEPNGTVRFRLWAPNATPKIIIDDGAPLAMQPHGDGWYELRTAAARAGSRYRYVVNDDLRVPDPASRYQPEDVHGPSEVIDPNRYAWSDEGWNGRPWHDTVLYELHVGTFTPEGTYRAAVARLDALASLGITAVELMPLSEAPGRWNWGYDGVLPYAPQHDYGSVDDLKAFIDAAHARELMVFIDVVYNHFGPDGNYLPVYAPQFFTERHHTPWGAGINVDGEHSQTVRDFFIHNALYWLEEFHVDGLRFDAVHAIRDDSSHLFLQELAERVHDTLGGRQAHLVLENEDNAAMLLGGRAGFDAQWNDDVHNLLHVVLTGESSGYYRDYVDGTIDRLGRALATGFGYQGEPSPNHDGAPRGSSSGHLPPTSFVNFTQNHDQVGNRAFGERLSAIADPAAVRAAQAVVLLGPAIPLLFMGEEWSASTPFLFFADFSGELAEAVRNGRRSEFKKFPAFADPAARERIPDPIAETTVRQSTLKVEEAINGEHAGERRFIAELLDIRRREIIPRLRNIPGGSGHYAVQPSGALVVSWTLGDGSRLAMHANLSDRAVAHEPSDARHAGRRIATVGRIDERGLAPWSVGVFLDETSHV